MSGEAILVIGQLHQGGAEGQLVSLATGLKGTEYTPVVACLSEVSEPHASRLSEAGIHVEIFPRRRGRDLSRLTALGRFLRARRPSVIHSFLVGANAYAYGASRLAGARPLVASSRTCMAVPYPMRAVHGWVFRRAEAVIANSAAVADLTARHYGVPRESIHVVPNGVDLRPFRESAAGAAAARRGMGAGPRSLVVGTLGRLSAEKNLPLFIEMAAALAGRHPRARFVIVGDGPERGRLEELARETSLGERLLFTGARTDVPAVLGAMDIFVLPSSTEGLPNAVMEAMAAALPVVATRVGGTREILEEGVQGLLVDPGDLEGVTAAVAGLAEDAPRRRSMGQAGRRRIEEGYSVGAMVEATRRVYGIAGGRRASAGGSRR